MKRYRIILMALLLGIVFSMAGCGKKEQEASTPAATGDKMHVGMNYKELRFQVMDKSENNGDLLFTAANSTMGALRVHVPSEIYDKYNVGDEVGIGQTKQFDVGVDSFGIVYYIDEVEVSIEDPDYSEQEAAEIQKKLRKNVPTAEATLAQDDPELTAAKNRDRKESAMKDSSFGEAMDQIVRGRKVRRSGWDQDSYIYKNGDNTMLHSKEGEKNYSLDQAAEDGDLTANDWASVDE